MSTVLGGTRGVRDAIAGPWRGRDLALIAGTLVALLLVQALVVDLWGLPESRTGERRTIFALFPTLVTAAGVLMLARQRGLTAAALGFRRPRSWTAPFLAWAGAVLVGPLYAALVVLLGGDVASADAVGPTAVALRLGPAAGALTHVLGIGLLAPVAEELIFRGLIFRAVRQRWSLVPALAIGGLVFSAAHLDATTLAPLFLVGVLFAWAYERSGSLWGSIVPHAGLNLLTLLALVRAGS